MTPTSQAADLDEGIGREPQQTWDSAKSQWERIRVRTGQGYAGQGTAYLRIMVQSYYLPGYYAKRTQRLLA